MQPEQLPSLRVLPPRWDCTVAPSGRGSPCKHIAFADIVDPLYLDNLLAPAHFQACRSTAEVC